MHTDAMILYRYLYGSWPQFDAAEESVERKQFVCLVAHLYASRHHHELAGQNAPGADGIKTPDMYLPKDICQEINRIIGKGATKRDDILATTNEVRKITPILNLQNILIPPPELLIEFAALQLGEQQCTDLYNALHNLICEKNTFSKSSSAYLLSLFLDSAFTANSYCRNNAR